MDAGGRGRNRGGDSRYRLGGVVFGDDIFQGAGEYPRDVAQVSGEEVDRECEWGREDGVMPRRPSHLELLAGHLLDELPGKKPVREYRFAPPRRWRFDFAYPERKVAVEVEGGVYSFGRHTRGKGYENDLEKYNTAVVMGWKVLRFTGGMVERGDLKSFVAGI